MQILIGAVLLGCWMYFLLTCYRLGQARREERFARRWHEDRELYRRERNR